jgi:hypothetical protein
MARTPATLLERYPEARAVQTFSSALLPGAAGRAGSDHGTGALLEAGVTSALERRLGVGVSLPVEADAFERLCSRSVEAQSWLTRRFLPFDVDALGPWWQAMTGGDSAFFCLNDAFPPELRQAVHVGLWATCAGSDEPASCVRRRLARFQPRPLAESPGAAALVASRVWEPFENGGPFASVWAMAELPRPLLAANDRGIVMPDAPGHSSLRALSAMPRRCFMAALVSGSPAPAADGPGRAGTRAAVGLGDGIPGVGSPIWRRCLAAGHRRVVATRRE